MKVSKFLGALRFSMASKFAGICAMVAGLMFAGAFVAGCQDSSSSSSSSKLDEIKKAKKIVIGVKDDVPKFALFNTKTNKIEGFEADVAELLKKSIISDGELVLKPVNAKTRVAMIDTGAVDAVIATFTITDERKKLFNFSEPYYDDYIGLLVLKHNGIESFKDLNGKTIGVAQGATTQNVIESAAKDKGYKITIQNYPDYPSLKSALVAKRIDAFSVDKSILLGYVDDKSQILKDNFSKQSYGIVTSKKDQAFSDYIDKFVKTHSSEIEALKAKWGLNNL